MSLQYISDAAGETTGVFIPIEEWNELKNKYNGIAEAEIGIPQWQKDIVRSRLDSYNTNPEQAIGFDEAMDDIEKDL